MKTVVFLRREPTSRLYNLAYALKKTNKYRVVLVCDRFDNYNLSKFNQVFDEIICYQILDFRKYSLLPTLRGSYLSDLVKDIISFSINWKIGYLCEHLTLPKILKKINPDACVCQHTEHFLTTQVIKNVKCPVILNVHNGSRAVGIESLSKKEYNLEKYCFEHAGGIIHRGPEFEIDYYREHRYNITCPILRYLDYCNKEFFLDYEAKKLSMQDKEYHLVDIGGGFSAYIFPTSNIKKITNQKMHFHQYFPRYIPHMFVYQSSHKVYRDIVNLYKSEKYFHFERPMPFDKITHEISKYDFGSMIDLTGYTTPQSQEYLKIATSYRLFTYLEAGLPIIINDGIEYMKKIVEENKVGIVVKDEEFDDLHNIIKSYDYEELKKNVFKAREKLLIDNYVKDVDKFFETVIQTA